MKTWQKLKNNPSLWEQYFIREKVLKATRDFFSTHLFHEVETPILIAHPPAESYLDIFETMLLDRHRNPKKVYLATSPETSLKKLMVAGLGDCFAITKSFRNMETQSNLHNPEFTIVEWYRVGVDYQKIMEDCEDLVFHIYNALNRSKGGDNSPVSRVITYQGKQIDISKPWERMTIADSFRKWAHVTFEQFMDFDAAKNIAIAKGYKVEEWTTWEELYNQIFLNEIEPHLGQTKPTILYEFPASMGALAKKKDSDPRFAERFEFYIAGLELGDCYSELTDWKEQEERFKRELKEIKRLGKTMYEYDHDFIEALKAGLPTCSGIAVGLDRLIMLFANVTDIADTMFFPGNELE